MYYELGSDAQMMNDAETDIAFDGPTGHQAVNLFKSFHSEGPIADRAAGRPPDAGQLGSFYFASAGRCVVSKRRLAAVSILVLETIPGLRICDEQKFGGSRA